MSEQDSDGADPAKDHPILGLSVRGLAGVSVEQLVNNQTAITLVLHYYKKLVDENSSLQNDRNTYKTYMDAYDKNRVRSKTGATLLVVSNVGIGFGTNLLTSGQYWGGACTLIPGVVMALVGLWFTLKEA